MTLVKRFPFKKSWWIPKRIFDFTVAFIGLVALSPLIAFVALIVRITSPGPVLFIQQRVGRYGKLFRCYKFRTMFTGADALGSITKAEDSRITNVGRVLRHYKLDELPQLWNVLTGKMSFVGPRPDVPGYIDCLDGNDCQILELLPGITGPATLIFNDEAELLKEVNDQKVFNDHVIYPEKVRINLSYMEKGSFFKDIGYIIATLAPRITRLIRLDMCLGIDYMAFRDKMKVELLRYKRGKVL